MTENSYSDLITNDKSSDDSYATNDESKGIFRKSNGSDKENVKKVPSKSESRSSSSQNDDRSEHYVRLLKESQQSVSNRDLLIGMLQRQLKKMEDLYKRTLDQQQDIRLNYSNAVQELSHLKIVCNKLTEENNNLLRQNEENAARYHHEREDLQIEVEKWKKEYDHLMKAIESMEKNTCAMKDILKDGNKEPKKQDPLNSDNMDKLLEHYVRIQEALTQQNEKLDTFLERFQVIGDGGCTIIKSLEGMKCVNKELTKSLDCVVAERAEQPFEQVPPPIIKETPCCKEPAPVRLSEQQPQKQADKPEKPKKNKKQKTNKPKQPDDEECDCSEELDGTWQQAPPQQKPQPKPKSKSKSKSQSRPQTPQDRKSCCDDPEENRASIASKPKKERVPTKDEATMDDSCCGSPQPKKEDAPANDKATMDDSYCGSECGCYDFSVILNAPTSEKAVNTDCDCFDEYDIPDDYEELRDRLVQAMQEIERLNKMLEDRPAVEDGRIVKCQNFPDPQEDDYEEILKERDTLKEENDRLEAVIANLENDVTRLTEDLNAAKRDLEDNEKERAELQKQIDSLLTGHDTNMEEINENLANALDETEALKEEKKALLEKINLLNESVRQHKDQTCLCKMELQKVNMRAMSLEDTLKNVQGDVRQRDSKQSKELVSTKANLAQLTESYNRLKKDYEVLEEDNKEIALLKRKNANLVRELDQRDVIIYELREQVVSLEKELSSIREEMLASSQTASREMDVLMTACMELESKLETTKEILEKEGSLIDEEVNTSNCQVESTVCNSCEIEALKENLDEKNEEIRKLLQESEEAKTTYQEELQAIKDHNDLLQLQLEQEQTDHQRDLEIAEEKLREAVAHECPATAHKNTSADDILVERFSSGEINDEDSKSDLVTRLEESLEENRNLKDDLDEANRELKELKETGKEFGILKAENMKLKSKISLLQKQMIDMKDIEDKMSKLKNDKAEMQVKVQYLENQVNVARNNNSLDKISASKKCCGATLATITEEETTVPAPAARSSKTPAPKNNNHNDNNKSCVCDEKKYNLNTRVTILYDNKKFHKASNTDSVLTVDSQQSTDLPSCSGGLPGNGNKLNKLQVRLASINQMEQQVANMIISVRQQNQRLNECNTLRMLNEKDIETRLHQLKHKREHLMTSLNSFQKEIEVLGVEARDKVKGKNDCSHYHCRTNNHKHH